jgi:hypothetical protein
MVYGRARNASPGDSRSYDIWRTDMVLGFGGHRIGNSVSDPCPQSQRKHPGLDDVDFVHLGVEGRDP